MTGAALDKSRLFAPWPMICVMQPRNLSSRLPRACACIDSSRLDSIPHRAKVFRIEILAVSCRLVDFWALHGSMATLGPKTGRNRPNPVGIGKDVVETGLVESAALTPIETGTIWSKSG